MLIQSKNIKDQVSVIRSQNFYLVVAKVIIEKSRSEVSLVEQDTIENVS